MRMTEEIHARLSQVFAPDTLVVEDDSEKHRGHGGWREGGETHFRVAIKAAAFGPMNRIARHRAIHAALGPDIVSRIHALSLEVSG
jgi:BolA family transcriptional regulator, general stress-responsive regulator